MDAQQNLIAEYMTKMTQRLDENNEQSAVVNFFLMTKEEQVADFTSWLGQKHSDLSQETSAVEAHYTQQVIEIEEKLQASEVFTQGDPITLPEPVVIEHPPVDEPPVEEVPE